MHIILSHENADFDAVAAMLAAYKLHPDALPILPERLNRNVAHFWALYKNGLPFVQRADLRRQRIERVTLVDTQRVPALKGIRPKTPIHVTDHHPLMMTPPPEYTLNIDLLGATTTILVEQIQARAVPLTSLEATLLALGIYEDTGSLTYRQTTPRDVRAAAWLLEQRAVLDTIRRFLEPPLTDEQQALLERLVIESDSRTIQGYTITIGAAKLDSYLSEISGVAHRLRDTLDPDALFLLVQMPNALHLVCRSTDDAINVGEIARFFGGGGHERAAAATLHDWSFEDALSALWEQVARTIRPAARVADLMSYGVRTLSAGKKLREVVPHLRRIGHEGYPVVESGQVVGLLTRRDADRALEHGLGDLTVREVMTSGQVMLSPNDSVQTLEQRMVESGWGQIPVVDDDGKPIGIVTRTDLINHWARAHPETPAPQTHIAPRQMEVVLGTAAARLIETVAAHANRAGLSLYLVGGVVRDLLLQRRNLDIDFVVEGDAIKLANSLRQHFGGEVTSFRPFGTAKWRLGGDVAKALALEPDALPGYVDFATSRNEFYEQPTALPTVYDSSIKLDLQRRDFTINTLAIQLSPAESAYRVLDFYGGMADLHAGLIRVLHSLSFVDDPTRILRAVRFEHRLDFVIESRTAELIETAKPMLRRITGERVRNELRLLLREDTPERGLLTLQERSILTAIHPALVINPAISAHFEAARTTPPPWAMSPPDLIDLYWHIIAANIPVSLLPPVCERLLFGRTMTAALVNAARLAQDADVLKRADTRPSQIAAHLDGINDVALFAAWLVSAHERIRERIVRYMNEWRYVRSMIDGHTLRALGLPPGRCYATILSRLRAARLDGETTGADEERAFLQTLIAEGICDDHA